MKKYLIIGGVFMVLAVLIGAFGAHGLKAAIGDNTSTFETGSKYHFYHALGIILIALVHHNYPSRLLKYASMLLIAGIVFFSFSLYLLALRDAWNLQNWKFLGPMTPIGGVFFVLGWILFVIGVLKSRMDE